MNAIASLDWSACSQTVRDAAVQAADGILSASDMRVICWACATEFSRPFPGLTGHWGRELLRVARETYVMRLYKADQAAWRVRTSVRPLMQARATKAAIEEAAGHAAQGALTWDGPAGIYQVLRQEAEAAFRTSRPGVRR